MKNVKVITDLESIIRQLKIQDEASQAMIAQIKNENQELIAKMALISQVNESIPQSQKELDIVAAIPKK